MSLHRMIEKLSKGFLVFELIFLIKWICTHLKGIIVISSVEKPFLLGGCGMMGTRDVVSCLMT